MSLLDYFTGGKKPGNGARTGQALTFMDRFMNPATQAGISMLSGGSAAEGLAAGNQYLQQKKSDLLQQSIGSSITDPEERALLMMAPEQYVAAKLSRTASRPIRVNDNTVYTPGEGFESTGAQMGANGWLPEEMRKEYNYEQYTPESISAAEAAGDPGLLVVNESSPSVNKDGIAILSTAQNQMNKWIEPLRVAQRSINIGSSLLKTGGGAADYLAFVSLVKSADPGTAAMAGEVDAASEANGYLNQIYSIGAKAQENGGFISPEQKTQRSKALDGLNQIYSKYYAKVSGYADKYSTRYGLDKELIMGPSISFGGAEASDFGKSKPLNESAGEFISGVGEATGVNDAISGAADAAGNAINSVVNPPKAKTQLVKENGKWVRKQVQQ